MRTPLFFAAFVLSLAACGPKLPPRYVVEKDLEDYRYRRYQQVVDVELPIEGNPAVGYTATYVKGGSTVRIAPVFVTAYERAKGLSETVRQRLRSMEHYTFDVREVEGEHVWRLKGEGGDSWLLWVSGKHLVKVGAAEGESDVPESIAEAYLELYPSDLDARGRAEPDAQSAGPAIEAAVQPADGDERADDKKGAL